MSSHLMAKFRRTAGWAEWFHNPDKEGNFYAEAWRAPLETGHELHVHRIWHPPSHAGVSWDTPWSWLIRGVDTDPDAPEHGRYHHPFDDDPEFGGHATKEESMRAAEQAYQRLVPIGTNTGSHDSGVDYDSVLNPRDDFDDDFGDIFGEGRP